MNFDLITLQSSLVKKQALQEILNCNELSCRYGLVLTEAMAQELDLQRKVALERSGRMEFDSGVFALLIKEFCDSPYLTMENYVDTLHELIRLFYYYKNESRDQIGDEELLQIMHDAFDGVCQGSCEFLTDQISILLANFLQNEKEYASLTDEDRIRRREEMYYYDEDEDDNDNNDAGDDIDDDEYDRY